MTWDALGKLGHSASITLAARTELVLDLNNASYNSQKIYPSSLLVQNSGNDGGVIIYDYQGTQRPVPPNTNYKISVSGVPQVTIRNNGRLAVLLLLLDKQGESESDVNLTPSNTTTGVSINDFLYHFEESPIANIVNSGAETAFLRTNTATVTQVNTPVNFGAGALAFTPPGVANIEWLDNKFFEMGKDFTLDFWIDLNGNAVVNQSFCYFSTAAGAVSVALRFTTATPVSGIQLFFSAGGGGTSGAVLSAGIGYQFVQLIKSGINWRLYVGGVKVIDITNTYAVALDKFGFGSPAGTTVNFFIDEWRFSKGFVQTDTSVPTAPYY